MSDKAPIEVWSRSVRRAIRDWTMDNGLAPGLLAACSHGVNPRRVHLRPRLDLLTNADQVAGVHRSLAREYNAMYAAIGKRLGTEMDPYLALICFSPVAVSLWEAQVKLDGLGGWHKGSFEMPPTLSDLQAVMGDG